MSFARLRKRYEYTHDFPGDDQSPQELDEEEQEQLIAKLREENEERNEDYKRMFLVVTVISAMTFLPSLITSSSPQAKLIGFLAICSLSCSAFVLIVIPTSKPKTSPIHRYIVPMNGALSLLVGLNSIVFYHKDGVHEGFWILCFVPIAARNIMVEVEIDELDKVRYNLKGA